MAKTKFDITSAIRGEIKTPAAELKKEEIETKEETYEEASAVAEEKTGAEQGSTPAVKGAKKRGRPRKDAERDAFIRAAVPTSFKKKLHLICQTKGITESDYIYEIVKKSVAKDFENALTSLTNDD